VLKRFEDYPDASDKWFFLLEPLGSDEQRQDPNATILMSDDKAQHLE